MEFVRSEVTAKVYGEDVKMRLPTYKETITYSSELKLAGDDQDKITETLFCFLEKLGLKRHITESLEIHHMNQLIDMLLKKTK